MAILVDRSSRILIQGITGATGRSYAQRMIRHGSPLAGRTSAGVMSPGKANLSDINDVNVRPGRIGIVSKSGTLTYEVIDALRARNLGVSSVVCLGGDRVIGTTYTDVLPLFEEDGETDA